MAGNFKCNISNAAQEITANIQTVCAQFVAHRVCSYSVSQPEKKVLSEMEKDVRKTGQERKKRG